MTQLIFTENKEDYQDEYPSYSDRGSILVEIYDISEKQDMSDIEVEILDADTGSSVFWIQEGIGIDFFVTEYMTFPKEGRYLIKNIHGSYFKGDGWTTDDNEEWEFDDPVETTLESLL